MWGSDVYLNMTVFFKMHHITWVRMGTYEVCCFTMKVKQMNSLTNKTNNTNQE